MSQSQQFTGPSSGVINKVEDLYRTPAGVGAPSVSSVQAAQLPLDMGSSSDMAVQSLFFQDYFANDGDRDAFWTHAKETMAQPVDPSAVNIAGKQENRSKRVQVTVDGDDQGEPEAKKPKVVVEVKQERRKELNRINAKKSRIRNKFRIECLMQRVEELEEQNQKLQTELSSGEKVDFPLEKGEESSNGDGEVSLGSPGVLNAISKEDYSMIDCLLKSKSNFCITDPHQPDNPIVQCSQGFYDMSGYSPKDVLGKNCRFLQGPGTKPETVGEIHGAMEKGESVAVTLLNYRKDGSHFWNQVFISPIMGADGKTIVHFIGVQREIDVEKLRTELEKTK